MTYEVLFGDRVIGTSSLENGDPSMGVVSGRFHPEDGYSQIREECRDNHVDQTYLNLAIRTPDGNILASTGVAIMDYSNDLGEEVIDVTALGIPYPLYSQLFSQHIRQLHQP